VVVVGCIAGEEHVDTDAGIGSAVEVLDVTKTTQAQDPVL
jgi:hypothetical protein